MTCPQIAGFQLSTEEPGETVVLKSLPPGLIDGLPEEDARAIKAIIGKPVLLVEYDEDERVLDFDDPFDGVPGTYNHTHLIWVAPKFIERYGTQRMGVEKSRSNPASSSEVGEWH